MNDGELNTNRVYAWIARDLDGCEGIITIPTEQGLMPLVATDERVIRSFKGLARHAGEVRRQSVQLVVFERGATLDSGDAPG